MPLKEVDVAELGTENVVHGCCTDGTSIFFCSWDKPAKIFKVNPVTLDVESLTLGAGWDVGNDIKFHNGYLWVCIFSSRYFRIARINTDLSKWETAVDSSPYKETYNPMSLAVDKEKDVIYCGAVYGVLALDVSNPDSVSYNALTGCPTEYNHAIAIMDGVLYGWGFKSFNWSNPTKPMIWKYDGTSFTSKDLAVSLTDDMYVLGSYVYGVSEEWSGQTQLPRVCRVDSNLNISYLSLDGNKIGHNIDGITAYKGRLYLSCRSNSYPFVEMTPNFTEVRYLPKSSALPVIYPDEGISFGKYLYIQSMDEPWGGTNWVHKLSYQTTVRFYSIPPNANVRII